MTKTSKVVMPAANNFRQNKTSPKYRISSSYAAFGEVIRIGIQFI